jgi:pimeloyl-ACP methyl ester carboxylesterase
VYAREPVRKDAYTKYDIDRYVEMASQPYALTAGMNYYRAALRDFTFYKRMKRIDAPVLIIWAERDVYISRQLAEPDRKWVPDFRVERIDCSHWIQNDQPERVNELILDFLRAGAPADVNERRAASAIGREA